MKSNFIMRFLLRTFLLPVVVGDKPFVKNSRTASVFVVEDDRDFELEKSKLIENIEKMQQDGRDFFEGRESSSFGKLTAEQWSRQFAKHFEHHFTQFGL